MTLRQIAVAGVSVVVGCWTVAAVKEGCASVDATQQVAAAEGRAAAEAGLPPESCPYSPVSPEHREWKRAWTAAKTKHPK